MWITFNKLLILLYNNYLSLANLSLRNNNRFKLASGEL
jgi:hypothetical protein